MSNPPWTNPTALSAVRGTGEGGICGIVVLDKPAGVPSNRALDRLKRLLGLRGRGSPKVGFLGTLDPIATGVLPVFLGKATKLIPVFEGLDKTYRATFRLGQRTDSFDADGVIVSEQPIGHIGPEAVEAAIRSFQGGYEQVVPRFSAVKVGGVPAYRLARDGKDVPQRTRTVRISELEPESVLLPHATFRVTCSAGTYVRSLVSDIGEYLGVGAHVTALRRLACGELFTEENSITLDRIEEALQQGDRGFILDAAAFLPDFRSLTVDDASERLLRDGRAIPLPKRLSDEAASLHPAAKAKAVRSCGTLVAIGEIVSFGPAGLGFQPSKVLV